MFFNFTLLFILLNRRYFRLSVVAAFAYELYLRRVGRGRKWQVSRWNSGDICHTFRDISTFGFRGRITISGCPQCRHLFELARSENLN